MTAKPEQTRGAPKRRRGVKTGGTEKEILPGSSGPVVVTVSGKMLISGSAAFRRSLIESFVRADWVEVDCSGLKDADLTFFQLLCSAHLTATRKNKKFTINGQYSAAFVTLARSMGLDRHVGCARDLCQSCIWTGGREL